MKRTIIFIISLALGGLLLLTPLCSSAITNTDNELKGTENKDIHDGTVISTFHKFKAGISDYENEDALQMFAKIQDNNSQEVYESLPLEEPLRVGDTVKFKISDKKVQVIADKNNVKMKPNITLEKVNN